VSAARILHKFLNERFLQFGLRSKTAAKPHIPRRAYFLVLKKDPRAAERAADAPAGGQRAAGDAAAAVVTTVVQVT